MQNERNSFDDKIRQSVDDYAFPFEPAHWEDMQRRLDAAAPVAWWKKRNTLLIALLLIVSTFVALYLQTLTPQAIVKNAATKDSLEVYKPQYIKASVTSIAYHNTTTTNITNINTKKKTDNSSAIPQNLPYLETSDKGDNKSPIVVERKARYIQTYRHSVKNALTSSTNGGINATPSSGAVNGNRWQMINTPFQAIVITSNLNHQTVTPVSKILSLIEDEGSYTSNNNTRKRNPNFNQNNTTINKRISTNIPSELETIDNVASNNQFIGNKVQPTASTSNISTTNKEELQPFISDEDKQNTIGSQPRLVNSAAISTWLVASFWTSQTNNRGLTNSNTFNEQGTSIGIKTSYPVLNKVSVVTGLVYAHNQYHNITRDMTDSSLSISANSAVQNHWQIPIQVQYQLLQHKNLEVNASAGTVVSNTKTITVAQTVENMIQYQAQHLASISTQQHISTQTSKRKWNTAVNLSLNLKWSLNEHLWFMLSPYWQRGGTDVHRKSVGVGTSIGFKF